MTLLHQAPRRIAITVPFWGGVDFLFCFVVVVFVCLFLFFVFLGGGVCFLCLPVWVTGMTWVGKAETDPHASHIWGGLLASVSAQDGIVSLGKCPYALRPVSQQSPQGCPWNSANICLVEHRSFSQWWNVGRFVSPLLFPSGDQCCDALACPCSESSSSLGAPQSCQAVISAVLASLSARSFVSPLG